MKKSPYPQDCKRRSDRKKYLEDKATQMAESGNFENAHAIRQRLINLNFGTLVGDVIPEDAEGFNFTYRLDDMCRTHSGRNEHI